MRAAPARLRWRGDEGIDPGVRERLLGPGAPFELVVEDVLGAPTLVFAQRPPNLPAVLDSAVERHDDRPFLVTPDGRHRSFVEVRATVDAVAARLASEHGVRQGDRVAIVAANCPEYRPPGCRRLT